MAPRISCALLLLVLSALIGALCAPVGAAPAAAAAPDVALIDDFENGLRGWPKGLRLVSDPVKQGRHAALWEDPKTLTCLKKTALPHDWSGQQRLLLWCHSAKATGARILLVVSSENSRTQGPDYYFLPITVDWAGWRQLRLPLHAMRRGRQPVGWQKIDWLAFYSAGYADCLQVEGTRLVLDDIRLAHDEPDEAGVLGDFEYDIGAWLGVTRDTALKHTGTASACWQELGATRLIRCVGIPADWSRWDGLEVWIHSAAANGQVVALQLYSDNPATPLVDSFATSFRVNWQGWKQLRFRLDRDFQVIRSPNGWDRIDQMVLIGNGNGIQPQSGTLLHLDDVRLTRVPPTPEVTISDMEEEDWLWAGLVRDGTAPKQGQRCGRWSDMKSNKLIRITRLPRDWTRFSALRFWCRGESAHMVRLKVLLYSDTPQTTRTDLYMAAVEVPPGGWRQVTVPLRSFAAIGTPAGWHAISNLTIAGDGFGLQASPTAILWLDDVVAVRRTPVAAEAGAGGRAGAAGRGAPEGIVGVR